MAGTTRAAGAGFLAMAFAVVGMTGIFATYAAPIPLQRALLREAALDDALAAGQGSDPQAALAALAPRLGDSAAQLSSGGADLPARVQAARVAMRRHFAAQAAAEASRLRLMIGVVTLAGAIFGAAALGFGRG